MKFGEKLDKLEEYVPFSYKPGMIRLDANESCLELPEDLKSGIGEIVSNIALNRYPDPYCKNLRSALIIIVGVERLPFPTSGNPSARFLTECAQNCKQFC